MGEKIIRYDGFGATISPHGIAEVYFLPQTIVSVSDIDVFGDSAALRRLCDLDGEPKEFLGFIIFFKIGITLTGFHDGDKAQQAVTAFEKGRWNQLISQMQ